MSETPKYLRLLHDSMRPHPVPGGVGQQCGNESYRIIATGNQFNLLLEAADALESLERENRELVEALKEALPWLELRSTAHVAQLAREVLAKVSK